MKKLFLILFSASLSIGMMAQCAMCRVTAEQASEKNSGIAEGLNTGIVYLMLLPYLLFMIGGLVFFRKKIAAFFKN
jgi:amino acid transporter